MSYTKLYHTPTNIKNESKNEKKKPLEYTVLIIRRALDKVISYTNEYKKRKQK